MAYEQLVQIPTAQARALAAFLDEQCGTTTTATVIGEMAGRVDPALWRNRRSPDTTDDAMTDTQKRLYRFQQAKIADPLVPLTDGFPMPS
ncbi:MAG: hypothetical protein M3O70_26770 [Actinomycetota bacterium]|nr:hypothetical protein [Actinomycetota bacterium]